MNKGLKNSLEQMREKAEKYDEYHYDDKSTEGVFAYSYIREIQEKAGLYNGLTHFSEKQTELIVEQVAEIKQLKEHKDFLRDDLIDKLNKLEKIKELYKTETNHARLWKKLNKIFDSQEKE